MYSVRFGTARIFRPDPEIFEEMKKLSYRHLVSRFPEGEYHGVEAANSILQHQFRFYETRLHALAPLFASRGAAEFLLSQYDEAHSILHGKGIMDLEQLAEWRRIQPNFRRAIKYLVETICTLTWTGKERAQDAIALVAVQGALLAAEWMSVLSEMSSRVHSLSELDWQVWIFKEDGMNDFELRLSGPHKGFEERFWDRTVRDRNSRAQFLGMAQFDVATVIHAEYLNPAFMESFGMNYQDFLGAISNVINHSLPVEEGLKTLFVHQENWISSIAEVGFAHEAVERAIAGFSITSEDMKAEGRVMWNPKQEYRAYHRGFFVFPHETGPHLAFSRAMAKENFILLVNGVCYKRLPREWKSPAVEAALDRLSRAAGIWFEEQVARNLKELKVAGQGCKDTVGTGRNRISIPREVGEIDFLGYDTCSNMLLVIEAKMTMTGLEARYWRDDIDAFVNRKKSYAEKFRRKFRWVAENRERICEALDVPASAMVSGAMVTLYPCIAAEYIADFRCVTLTELALDFQQCRSWPYPPL